MRSSDIELMNKDQKGMEKLDKLIITSTLSEDPIQTHLESNFLSVKLECFAVDVAAGRSVQLT